MEFFFEDEDGDYLGDDEKDGDVDAHQFAEIEFREVDDEPIGDEQKGPEKEACRFALQSGSHSGVSADFQDC